MRSYASQTKNTSPELLICCEVLRVDRKMQASAQVMGTQSWATGLGCFLSFCGAEESSNRISKRSNPPLCTEGWPFSRLTDSLPCTTSLLKGWEQHGSDMQFHRLLHNQLHSRMTWKLLLLYPRKHTQNSEGKHAGSYSVVSQIWGISGGFVMAFPQQLCQATAISSISLHLHLLCGLYN